jgi:hypothetical protein
MLHIISQIVIFICGSLSIWLVGRKEHWRRWGYITGLSSQPFWYYETITNKQWILFIMCLVYTYSWAQGVYNFWIKK